MFGRAAGLSLQAISGITAELCQEYLYPAPWLFKNFHFVTRMLDMAQNNRFSDEIDREATEIRADAHLQDGLPGEGIPLKTIQIFLTTFWELYYVVSKPIWRVEISSIKIFPSYLSASLCFL